MKSTRRSQSTEERIGPGAEPANVWARPSAIPRAIAAHLLMLCLCIFFSSCRVIIMLNVTVLDKADPIGNPSNIQQVSRPPEPLCLRCS